MQRWRDFHLLYDINKNKKIEPWVPKGTKSGGMAFNVCNEANVKLLLNNPTGRCSW
jgi:hypothetical protein